MVLSQYPTCSGVMASGPMRTRHCETTASAPSSFHVGMFQVAGQPLGRGHCDHPACPFRMSDAANPTEIGTTSTCPPIIAVVAAPPDGKITFFIFLISMPTALKRAATPE